MTRAAQVRNGRNAAEAARSRKSEVGRRTLNRPTLRTPGGGAPARPGTRSIAGRGIVSLDIGSSALRAAQFSWRGRKCRLDRYAEVPTPEGAVVGGAVVDPALLGRALRDLWSIGRFT